MNSGVWGGLSALSLGTADFVARFTSRGIGKESALFGVLLIGVIALTGVAAVSRLPVVWNLSTSWLLLLNGAATTVMTLLLYQGLARGPVTVVAPIVATYPALVVAFDVMVGTRPTTLQWLGMALTLAGAVIIAGQAHADKEARAASAGDIRATIGISLAAAVAYAVLVVAGQAAVPIYGEFQTLWFGRVASLLVLGIFLLVRRVRPIIPGRWWPFLVVQALLDAGGYLFLFAGSAKPDASIAAVTGSTFGAVTTILAWLVLREMMAWVQWIGVGCVFIGVAALSITVS
jgi:uncharacterized membrane protein